MSNDLLLDFDPNIWSADSVHSESTLHQLSPYVGKMKSTVAKILIEKYSKPNDTILDPFVGSGTIALESLILKRNIICYDINPYSIILTRAKLNPLKSESIAINKIKLYLSESKELTTKIDVNEIPQWLKKLYHPQTLLETVAFSKLLLQNHEYFLLASLLGILHHQRPGFLSFPSSHSIPYLRDKKFPLKKYPELYTYRDLESRIYKKIKRVYKRIPTIDDTLIRTCEQKNVLNIDLPKDSIDTIITSPPYMDTLDYYRDNRVRLWFCGIEYKNKELYPNPKNVNEFKKLVSNMLTIFNNILKSDGKCILVIGDVNKEDNNKIINTGKIVMKILEEDDNFTMDGYFKDVMIKIKRNLNSNLKQKEEWIIVSRKRK